LKWFLLIAGGIAESQFSVTEAR